MFQLTSLEEVNDGGLAVRAHHYILVMVKDRLPLGATRGQLDGNDLALAAGNGSAVDRSGLQCGHGNGDRCGDPGEDFGYFHGIRSVFGRCIEALSTPIREELGRTRCEPLQ